MKPWAISRQPRFLGVMLVLAVSTVPMAAWSAEEGTCVHGDNAKHFVVRASERLTAFLELESAIRAFFPAFRCTP